jgi:hypothetical protein
VVELSLLTGFFLFFAPFVSAFLNGGVKNVVSGYAINRN